MSDNRIASLDSDWSVFLPDERAAFSLARKLTIMPYAMDGADIVALHEHFSDEEIVALVFTIARFNSVTRWTDALGIPQDRQFRDGEIRFDTPTSGHFLEAPSLVAPKTDQKRPPLEERAEVERALAECRKRSSRVRLPSEEEARKALPSAWKDRSAPQWALALSLAGQSGAAQAAAYEAMANEGRIDKLLKAQIAWICARQDRAWYALADAERRLAALGQGTEQVLSLDQPAELLSPAVREALAFSAKLTAAPHTMADADIARVRKHFSAHETAEIVYVVCAANMFDRFTEARGLPWTD